MKFCFGHVFQTEPHLATTWQTAFETKEGLSGFLKHVPFKEKVKNSVGYAQATDCAQNSFWNPFSKLL